MGRERRFISDALQAVYLQFRDNDQWMTVRDFNPSSYEQLHFYDDRVRRYINLDLLNLEISYRNKEIQVTGKFDPDLLVHGDVSNRLRLALLSNNKWVYLHFDIVIGENGSPVMKFRVSADDPNAINVVTQQNGG